MDSVTISTLEYRELVEIKRRHRELTISIKQKDSEILKVVYIGVLAKNDYRAEVVSKDESARLVEVANNIILRKLDTAKYKVQDLEDTLSNVRKRSLISRIFNLEL